MITITVKTSITREFHLDEAEDVARKLYNMGYELQRGEKIDCACSSFPELAALLKLMSPIEREDVAQVEISCGCR